MRPGNQDYTIRNLDLEEIRLIPIEWAAGEGWNPGLHDAGSFYETDPNGFFAGFINGEPISCISMVKYSPHFAFLGFYIVRPQFRGRGYGLKIWNAALKYAGSTNIGLDGVVEQQENYKKSGFSLAYRNIRYEGVSLPSFRSFPGIVPVQEEHFEELLSYDFTLFPTTRPGFLKNWLHQPDSFAYMALRENKIAGYIQIRKCRRGYKTGPLFADTPEIARQLLLTSFSQPEAGTPVFLDTPEVNLQALTLAESLGMKKVFETARMYTGRFPETDMRNIFGITSFELG